MSRITSPQASAPLLTAAQARIVAAALELFAHHGVGGTSLQMIADAIGVTKAAVYHQFQTKDEIMYAAAQDELDRLESVLRRAESESSRGRRRQALLAGVVDLAVERRRTVSVILSDPVVLRSFVGDRRYEEVIDRFTALLMAPDAGPDGRLQTAMFMAALSGAVMHPMMAELGDDTLRTQLLHLARRFH